MLSLSGSSPKRASVMVSYSPDDEGYEAMMKYRGGFLLGLGNNVHHKVSLPPAYFCVSCARVCPVDTS